MNNQDITLRLYRRSIGLVRLPWPFRKLFERDLELHREASSAIKGLRAVLRDEFNREDVV